MTITLPLVTDTVPLAVLSVLEEVDMSHDLSECALAIVRVIVSDSMKVCATPHFLCCSLCDEVNQLCLAVLGEGAGEESYDTWQAAGTGQQPATGEGESGAPVTESAVHSRLGTADAAADCGLTSPPPSVGLLATL